MRHCVILHITVGLGLQWGFTFFTLSILNSLQYVLIDVLEFDNRVIHSSFWLIGILEI
jgi:hypothetical protein